MEQEGAEQSSIFANVKLRAVSEKEQKISQVKSGRIIGEDEAKKLKEESNSQTERILLVIDYTTNWYEKFGVNAKTKAGDRIRVEQTEWKDIHVEATSYGVVKVLVKKSDNPIHASQKEDRVIKPDFMLIRNFPGDIHENSFRNIVMALLFAGIPAVNSLESIFRCLDRPLVHAEMSKIGRKMQRENHPHPLNPVPMDYHPNLKSSTTTLIPPSKGYPVVIKVGSTHAGYGKICAKSGNDLKDVQCVLALHNDFYTVEPFVTHEYEFRIQKIGNHYRAFRRNSDSHWKNNWGNLQFVDHEWREEYKDWADRVSKELFGGIGGLDIIALDVLHTADGKDVILELNDTANGLMFEHEGEDLGHIRDLVIERMSDAYPVPNT